MNVVKKLFVALPAIALEALIIFLLVTVFKPWATAFEVIFRILGVIFVLFIISYRQEGTYKILWLLFFTSAPIPAAVAYLIWGNKKTVRPITERIKKSEEDIGIKLDDEELLENIGNENQRLAQSLRYVENLSGAPITPAASTKYYPVGEECWKDMLEEMKKAKDFIYLEYFIVQDGKMWDEMEKIMEQKAKEGVDVRFVFDDLGSIATFSGKDMKKLTQAGIKWLPFNKLKIISGTLNNRSHRKMLIIDGKTAFSGGVNLADEYINEVEIFGHWKDIGFKITGPAVGNYLYMFASFWNAGSEDKIPAKVFDMVPKDTQTEDGVVLSYYDSPGNRDAVSNNFYIEMLGNAKEYAWFYTPYLMLGDTLQDAFVRAAQRGVDVRIITPGIPDKKMVFRITRSFYPALMEAGVKIYEYTPGFVHAKASIYDDTVCTIGTVNLDYRSLYLHFENNSIFINSGIAEDLKKDFLKTKSKCRQMSEEKLNRNLFGALFDGILRIFSPLL